MKRIKKRIASFTLVEVLVFVTVLSMFFISAVSITTFSLRNLKTQEHKILATRYAEEGMEWLKQEKEDDWQIFAGHDSSSGGGTTYCMNDLSSVWGVASDCNNSYTLANVFKRSAVLTSSGNPVDSVTAILTVSWIESGVDHTVVLKSSQNLWEQ